MIRLCRRLFDRFYHRLTTEADCDRRRIERVRTRRAVSEHAFVWTASVYKRIICKVRARVTASEDSRSINHETYPCTRLHRRVVHTQSRVNNLDYCVPRIDRTPLSNRKYLNFCSRRCVHLIERSPAVKCSKIG